MGAGAPRSPGRTHGGASQRVAYFSSMWAPQSAFLAARRKSYRRSPERLRWGPPGPQRPRPRFISGLSHHPVRNAGQVRGPWQSVSACRGGDPCVGTWETSFSPIASKSFAPPIVAQRKPARDQFDQHEPTPPTDPGRCAHRRYCTHRRRSSRVLSGQPAIRPDSNRPGVSWEGILRILPVLQPRRHEMARIAPTWQIVQSKTSL